MMIRDWLYKGQLLQVVNRLMLMGASVPLLEKGVMSIKGEKVEGDLRFWVGFSMNL